MVSGVEHGRSQQGPRKLASLQRLWISRSFRRQLFLNLEQLCLHKTEIPLRQLGRRAADGFEAKQKPDQEAQNLCLHHFLPFTLSRLFIDHRHKESADDEMLVLCPDESIYHSTILPLPNRRPQPLPSPAR